MIVQKTYVFSPPIPENSIKEAFDYLSAQPPGYLRTNYPEQTKALLKRFQEVLKSEKEKELKKIMTDTAYLQTNGQIPDYLTVKQEARIKPDVHEKATFYKNVIAGNREQLQAALRTFKTLGAIPPADPTLGTGDNLLPTNLSNELLTEPYEENSLRQIEKVSQVRGLTEPILNFQIDESSLSDITDKQTAREIELSANLITYERFKTKIFATVTDTVMYGTNLDLIGEIEAGLRSGLATKEKMTAFATVADGKHDHMSFYLNGIKEVEGANTIQAIMNAWADLPEMFANQATCVMRKIDYYGAIMQLANGSDTLWGKKPEDILGIPVVFNDYATTPIVGDFRYARLNYDIGTFYDSDQDAKKGEYYFVLTAWFDHRIRLKSAFRLAKVED